MAQTFDPLACIPSPDVVRRKLEDALTLAERLRILLDVAERISTPQTLRQAVTVKPGGGS